MYLIQILLPLRDNQGRPFPGAWFEEVRGELTERFGGVTAYLRSPAQGAWKEDTVAEDTVAEDTVIEDIVIYEVMVDDLDREWWQACRARLAEKFRQQELVVRALPAERL